MDPAVSTSIFLSERRAITDDHQADIRGLATAFHCVRPELTQSRFTRVRVVLIPHNADEDSPIAALLSLIFLSSVLMTRRCFHNGPYEAAELSRDGGDGDVKMFLVAQTIEPS